MVAPVVITNSSPKGGNSFAIYNEPVRPTEAPAIPGSIQDALATLQQIKENVEAVMAQVGQMNQAVGSSPSTATDFEAEYILTKS